MSWLLYWKMHHYLKLYCYVYDGKENRMQGCPDGNQKWYYDNCINPDGPEDKIKQMRREKGIPPGYTEEEWNQILEQAERETEEQTRTQTRTQNMQNEITELRDLIRNQQPPPQYEIHKM